MSSATRLARFWIPLLLLATGVCWSYHPYFSSSLIGGTDARWYSNMLHDALIQARGGTFPVLVGQTEYNWTGGVHPVRSAPMHIWLGQAIDLLTARSLNVNLIQHLALITATLVGALSVYWMAVKRAPERFVEAAILGWVYVTCATWRGVLSFMDAYMSFTAMAALPWVFWGTLRACETEGKRGLPVVAVAIVATWMSHPPIGMLASLCAATALAVAAMSLKRLPWREAAVAAGCFGGIGAYYFLSMSEIRADPLVVRDVAAVAGVWVAFVGITRGVLQRRPPVIAAGLAGIALAGVTRPALGIAVAIFAVLFALIHFFGKQRKLRDNPGVVAIATAVVAMMITQVIVPTSWIPFLFVKPREPIAAFVHGLHTWVMAWRPDVRGTYFQPGWPILIVFVSFFLLTRDRLRIATAFLAASLLLFASLVRIPLLSDYLLLYFPPGLGGMCNYPLDLRLFPVFMALLSVFCLLSFGSPRVGGVRLWIGRGALAVAVVLQVFALTSFQKRAATLVNAPVLEQRRMSSEGRERPSFVYDLLKIPDTFYTGVFDPRIDARFFANDGRMVLGPDEIAAAMERQHVEQINSRYEKAPGMTTIDISALTGGIAIAPGEYKLVRVAFAPEFYREGVWTWHSPRVYREYITSADPGQPMAFGNSARKGNVIPVWNAGTDPLQIRWEFVSYNASKLSLDGGAFATLYVSSFDLEHSPIRVRSFDERVVIEVDAPEAGDLATFRSFIPGYKATVDGTPARITTNENQLVCVPLEAGTHRVELTFEPTLRVRIGGWISFVSLLVLLGFAAKRLRATPVDTQSAHA